MEWFIRDISKKYFTESTPQNYLAAQKTIGGLTILADDITSSEKVTVAVAEAASTAMSVAESDGVVTITLGTTSASSVTADDTKNTPALIAAAINASESCKAAGISATYSGTTALKASNATSQAALTAGHLGTPTFEPGIGFVSNGTYYICKEANGTDKNAGWKTFTLSDLA